ncbi:MAG: hypothetical protein NZ561_13355, partial [Phycisphaerae bacterium]|nr:hypothetical protein [Phycisphaerae bacterium]
MRSSSTFKLQLAAMFAAGLSLHVNPADAVNKTWIAGDGSWNVAANWNPSGAPADGDAVFLTSSDGLSRTVTYNNVAIFASFPNTVVSASAGGTFIVNQAAFTHNGANLALGTTGRGIWNKTGGTLNVTTLNMATAGGSSGTFSHSGGTINSSTVNIGQTGNGTFLHSGGTLNVSGTVNVSDNNPGGSGYLELRDTARLIAPTITIHNGGTIAFPLDGLSSHLTTGTVILNAGGTWHEVGPVGENNDI